MALSKILEILFEHRCIQMYMVIVTCLKKEYSGKLGAEETRVLTFLVIAALHAYLIILASDSWLLRS